MTTLTPVPAAADAATVGARFFTRTPPVFDTASQERRHRLERLAGICRLFGRLGFAEGLLGHITVRDPEDHDLLWVNPLGVSFRRMTVSALIQVNHEGTVLAGQGAVNPVGLMLHAAVHRARPEVVTVCHAHSPQGKAFSTLGRVLDPITQDSAVFFGQQALIREPRLTLDVRSADQFAAALGQHRVAIQVGHGIFTTGETPDEAAWWFVAMERACEVQLIAQAAGTPELWPEAMATGLARSQGSAGFGWLSFQPLWEDIVASDPDLFD
jgi:ribulose-5-phosphate 4-epimerase/fuculose-1-phosphate aldolase